MSAEGAEDNVRGGDELITIAWEGRSETIQAERSLLCNNSKYFEGSCSFEEGKAVVKFDPEIVSFDSMQLLVQFMKNKALKVTLDNVEGLFFAADYFGMDNALKILMGFLRDTMGQNNALLIDKHIVLFYLRIFDITERFAKMTKIQWKPWHSNSKIFKCPAIYIAFNFNLIMNERDLLNLGHESLKSILDNHWLKISEADVCRTVKMWVNFDIEARRKHFPTLIQCMRYSNKITTDFVMNELLCNCPKANCQCLISTELAIAFLAKQNGYEKKFKNGEFFLATRWD